MRLSWCVSLANVIIQKRDIDRGNISVVRATWHDVKHRVCWWRVCTCVYIKSGGCVVGDTKRGKFRVISYLQELAFWSPRTLISELNRNDNTRSVIT